jgi:hypothetical protein
MQFFPVASFDANKFKGFFGRFYANFKFGRKFNKFVLSKYSGRGQYESDYRQAENAFEGV